MISGRMYKQKLWRLRRGKTALRVFRPLDFFSFVLTYYLLLLYQLLVMTCDDLHDHDNDNDDVFSCSFYVVEK